MLKMTMGEEEDILGEDAGDSLLHKRRRSTSN